MQRTLLGENSPGLTLTDTLIQKRDAFPEEYTQSTARLTFISGKMCELNYYRVAATLECCRTNQTSNSASFFIFTGN